MKTDQPYTANEIKAGLPDIDAGRPVTIPPMHRTFDTGATRDTESGKLDLEGFLSPLVLKRYAKYLHGHRTMKDGSTRDSDNWQKGIPFDVYMKSAWRHFIDMWSYHRGWLVGNTFEDAMCGLLFNVMGYLHEHLKAQTSKGQAEAVNAMKDAKSIAAEKAFDEADLISQVREGIDYPKTKYPYPTD